MKICAILIGLFFITANAEELVLLDKGKLLFEEKFKGQQLDKKTWVSSKTKTGFEVKDGAYFWDCSKSSDGKKRVSLQHRLESEVGDLILEYEFTPGPGFKSATAVFNDEYGHCIVTILGSDKLESLKFPNKKKSLTDYAEYGDACGANLKAGKTYKVRIEICGSRFFIYIDNRHFLMGQNPRFKNSKTLLHFSFQGQTGKLANVRLYQGTPKEKTTWDKWSKMKQDRLLIKDASFLQKKKISDARQQLKSNSEYQKLILQSKQLADEVKAAYPFFMGWRKSERKKHSEVMKSDSTYRSQLNKLTKLRKAELDFITSKIQDVKSIER